MGYSKREYSDQLYRVSHRVEAHQHNMRLDLFMAQFMGSLSREFIKRKIKKGEIKISNRHYHLKSSSRVRAGDTVTLSSKRHSYDTEYWQGKKIAFDENPQISFEDDGLLIFNKPPFMSSHPTGRHLFYCATNYAQKHVGVPIHLVHRLDRETSGLMAFCKNLELAQKLTLAFENKQVKKCYFLIGKKNANYGASFPFFADERIEQVGPSKNNIARIVHAKNSKLGKPAKTFFHKLYENQHYLLALAFPQTGRQHQIRLHALAHGFPLLGDKLYLENRDLFRRFKDNLATDEDHQLVEIQRHALHSLALNFEYKGKRTTFLGALPSDLTAWVQKKIGLDQQQLWGQIESLIYNKFDK